MVHAPSILHFYSVGQAAENLVTGEHTLMIIPVEHLSYVDGEVRSNPQQIIASGIDSNGNTFQSKAVMDTAIEAKWYSLQSNRYTPPDVRRGERVLIWRVGDSDIFLWSETNLDTKLRNLETVLYAFNASPNPEDTDQTQENHYFLEVSTHKGTVTFKTSKANGEVVSHTLQFNPMAGNFLLADDQGQTVFIDSVNHVIHLVNQDASEVTLSKKSILVKCSDTMNFSASQVMNIAAPTVNLQATTLNVDASTFNITSDGVSATITNALSITAGSANLKASGSVAVDTPTATISGVTISNGRITCAGINSSGNVNAPNIK